MRYYLLQHQLRGAVWEFRQETNLAISRARFERVREQLRQEYYAD